MNPIQWLEHNVPGFSDLSENERQAILNFSLLWSLFEARAFNSRASSQAILSLSHEWQAQGNVSIADFQDSLEYFRMRYFTNGQPSQYFDGLNLRANDNPALVRSVLTRQTENPADCIAVILIVIYRFRNNLFHGMKWAYGIRGQFENFANANSVLLRALSIAELRAPI